MRFSDFISTASILTARNDIDAIRELVDCLARHGQIQCESRESIIKDILEREKEYGTGIGEGVAHSTHETRQRGPCRRHGGCLPRWNRLPLCRWPTRASCRAFNRARKKRTGTLESFG